jgi:NADPH-ferrihemoprotein reductase
MSWTIAFIGTIVIGAITWYFLRKLKKVPEIQEDLESLGNLHIYVGSQTGHSIVLSEILAAEAKKYHFCPHIVSLEKFQILEFKKHDFCVIICSTQVDGNPPDSAVQFLKWVTKSAKSSTENLSTLSFSVFGLSKSSQNNGTARKINEGLAKLGATQMTKLGESDEDERTIFQNWMNDLWKVLPEQAKHIRRSKNSEYLEVAHQVPLDAPSTYLKYEKATTAFLSSTEMKITKIKELKRDPEYSTLNIEIEKNSGYETGGKIGIFPENDEDIVREVAGLQGYDLELTFKFLSPNKLHPFPTPISVRDALTKYCDLTTLVRKKILKKLASFAHNPEEQQKLEFLASLKGKDEFKRKLVEPMVTIPDLFKMFPSIKIPLSVLVQILDRIEPRYYNIASSVLISPHKIQIAVEVLRERTCEGKVRTGLCSGYLEKMHVTGLYKNIRGILLPSMFKLPSTPSVIHMICNRCGIAAFKGILLEIQRQALSNIETHQIYLYLGCKSKSTQFIYKQDIERLIYPATEPPCEFEYVPEKQSEGPFIIKKMFAEFSRDQATKRYVKDILFTQQENLWDSLSSGAGYIMVCGSTSMGKSVREWLFNIASDRLDEGASDFLKKLSSQNRYIEELWD